VGHIKTQLALAREILHRLVQPLVCIQIWTNVLWCLSIVRIQQFRLSKTPCNVQQKNFLVFNWVYQYLTRSCAREILFRGNIPREISKVQVHIVTQFVLDGLSWSSLGCSLETTIKDEIIKM